MLFQWNWTRYVEAVYENTNVTINPAVDRVIVVDLQYFQKLPLLLSITPPATIGTSNFRTLVKTSMSLDMMCARPICITHRCFSTYVHLHERGKENCVMRSIIPLCIRTYEWLLQRGFHSSLSHDIIIDSNKLRLKKTTNWFIARTTQNIPAISHLYSAILYSWNISELLQCFWNMLINQ